MRKQSDVKFLVDESVEYGVVLFLRVCGFNVTAITEDSPSISDTEVLDRSYKEKRVLVTNDSDFGTLIFKENRDSSGVIFIRLPFANTSAKISRLQEVISSSSGDLNNLFITVTEKRIRLKLLPG